jgi:hypothetical protein
MCHERWVRHSEEAVARAWLRDLTQRDRERESLGDDALDDVEAPETETVLRAVPAER